MSLVTRHAEDNQVTDKVRHISGVASATLTVRDQRVEVTGLAGNTTIYLPYVAEAAGKIFSIHAVNVTAGNVIVTDRGDSYQWVKNASEGDITLSAAGDGVLLYSDGKSWFEIKANYSYGGGEGGGGGS